MKKINKFYFLFLISLFLLVAPALRAGLTAEVEKEPHQVPRVTGKVKIDGVLDEAVWQEALILELKYEVEPGENIKAPVKTEVLLIYGAKHLYAAFRAYDPQPGEIRAHVTDRDNITNDDHVA